MRLAFIVLFIYHNTRISNDTEKYSCNANKSEIREVQYLIKEHTASQ